MSPRYRAWLVALLLLFALAGGCGEASGATPDQGTDERASSTVKVAAASDLRRALTAMQPALEQTCNTRLTFVFGSSGQLKEQIAAGADYAIFFSADSGYVDDLNRAGLLVSGGAAPYGIGRLALAWRRDMPPLAGVTDLTRAGIRRIAIANPAHAPYGRAAREAMETAGVWDGLRNGLVLGENVRQATDYVQTGNVDAALIALALVIDTDTPYLVVDAAMHRPILQAAGVVKGSGGELTGRCLLQYVLSPDGQGTLKRFGFEPAPAP